MPCLHRNFCVKIAHKVGNSFLQIEYKRLYICVKQNQKELLMNNRIKTAALVVAMIFSINTFAGDALVKVTSSKSFQLVVDDMDTDFDISLYDQRERRIYNDHVRNQKDYTKQFSLEKLPAGTYTLRVENNIRTQEYRVELTSSSVEVTEVLNEVTFKPGIFFKNERLHVNAFSMGKVSEVLVRLENNRDGVVFENIFTGEENFGKIYDTSSLPEGNYTVHVYSNGQSTKQNVTK